MARAFFLAVLMAGCAPSGGDSTGAADAAMAVEPDASLGPSADGQCHLPAYEPGACCDRGDGSQGLCVLDGCTDGAEAVFTDLCLALCAEQCIVGEALGPCCQSSQGVGRCEGASCVGAGGAEPSEVCATIAALPEGVGCGRAVPKTPLDAPCEHDAECESGFCANVNEARYCSQRCPPEVACPQWFACVDQVCEQSGRLGQGCQDSGQCASGLCVRVEGVAIPYCTTQCDDETVCPEGFACDLAQGTCLLGMPQ
jgi:hypothetical protein